MMDITKIAYNRDDDTSHDNLGAGPQNIEPFGRGIKKLEPIQKHPKLPAKISESETSSEQSFTLRKEEQTNFKKAKKTH